MNGLYVFRTEQKSEPEAGVFGNSGCQAHLQHVQIILWMKLTNVKDDPANYSVQNYTASSKDAQTVIIHAHV